jgi:hypothetical protein
MHVMTSAARGDLKALREMASRSHEAAEGRSDATALICLTEALTFSRIAAAGGCRKAAANTLAILLDLAALLRSIGETEQAAVFSHQAAALGAAA